MPGAVMARLLLVGCLAAGLTPPSRVVEALAPFPQLATCSGCASVVARRRVCAMLQTAAMRQDQPWKYLRPTSGTGTVLQQVCALPASSHLTRQQRHPNVLPEGVVACVVVARNASSTVAAATATRASEGPPLRSRTPGAWRAEDTYRRIFSRCSAETTGPRSVDSSAGWPRRSRAARSANAEAKRS